MNEQHSMDIAHDPAGHVFQTTVDGQRCVLEYSIGGKVVTITHTRVPQPVEGRGIASALMTAAMHAARSEGWKVIPACSYASAWMDRHPDYADLRVG
jgi:predicted GNAT family acetyltransferase